MINRSLGCTTESMNDICISNGMFNLWETGHCKIDEWGIQTRQWELGNGDKGCTVRHLWPQIDIDIKHALPCTYGPTYSLE